MKTALVVLGNIFLYTVMCPLGRCARGQGQMPPLPSLSVRHWFIVIIRASAGQTLSRTNWRHIPRSVAISGSKFNLVKSFLTHSFQVFLLLPLPTCPTTSYTDAALYPIDIILPLHMSIPAQSIRCHNRRYTVNAETAIQFLLDTLSLRVTPHIFRIIACSALSSLLRSPFIIGSVSLP